MNQKRKWNWKSQLLIIEATSVSFQDINDKTDNIILSTRSDNRMLLKHSSIVTS
jgi:hypothetical protein